MSKLEKFYGSFDKPVPEHIGGTPAALNCDVAVIGGGGAGLAAAARASQKGKRVILIEKMPVLGGDTRLAGGLLCTNSEKLKAKGVPDMTEAHIDEYRRHNMYTVNDELLCRYIRNTGTVFDWLVDNGMDGENTRIVMDKIVMIRDRTEWEPLRNPAYGPGLMGTAVTDTLIAMLEKNGVTVLMQTRVTGLKEKNGAVAGVTAVGSGCDYEITAENVVLASGGFGCSQELLQRYFPKYFTSDNYFTHYCLSHCTGDGIPMAEAVGAETGKLMSFGLESMVHMPGAYTLQRLMCRPEGLIVAGKGVRILPEDDIENGEFVMDRQPNGEAWYIFPRGAMGRLYQLALDNRRYGDWMPEIDTLISDIEKELKLGLVRSGETVETLAPEIGADPQTLAAAVREYAGFCEQGDDPEFHKPAEYLIPLGDEGPWYAVRITRKFDVTMGGVTVNSRIQALRPDGTVIPGLYVCGDIASGWMGEDYGPLFSSFAWAINSGYLAAEEICEA